ncbi:hypothetical protein NL676_032308 [Syzygium grande]|nr:hypothetical protein NL676_032308 [Syzygium grande]
MIRRVCIPESDSLHEEPKTYDINESKRTQSTRPLRDTTNAKQGLLSRNSAWRKATRGNRTTELQQNYSRKKTDTAEAELLKSLVSLRFAIWIDGFDVLQAKEEIEETDSKP